MKGIDIKDSGAVNMLQGTRQMGEEITPENESN